MSMKELSRRSDVPYDRLNKWIRGGVDNPRGDGVSRIAAVFDLTEQELKYGRGAEALLSSYDPDEFEPERPFDAEAPEASDPDAPPEIPPNGIVEVDARAGMGGGGQISHTYYRAGDKIETRDAVKPDPWIFPPWFLRDIGAKPGDLLVIEAKGDSMRPTIVPGTPLIIDTRHRIPSPDGIYAIRDRWGDIQAKRIETSKIIGDTAILVISDNGGHVQTANSEDELQIVGKVVAGWNFF